MIKNLKTTAWQLFSVLAFVSGSVQAAGTVCENYGPQTPRDIDQLQGSNKNTFAIAPDYQEMNLCNIHFHRSAEHKAKDFAIYDNQHGGYQCSMSTTLAATELQPTKNKICHGLKPGDTVEVHWVHSSCDIKPGKGLGSCLSDTCKNPDLRVETQVFTLVNDENALDFNELDYAGQINGYHQAQSIPNNTGYPVTFLGSTTGPKYTEQQCSPMQVTWSVRPQCAKLNIHSLGKWCESNEFSEDHAHGVRKLVMDQRLLSEIK